MSATIHVLIERAKVDLDIPGNAPWYHYEENADLMVRQVYIGRTYYIADGGGTPEFWEALEAAATVAGLCIEYGEGDPTDVYVAEYKPVDLEVMAE